MTENDVEPPHDTSLPPPSRAEDAVTPVPSRSLEDGGLPSDQVRFQHESEREFARLLDFYCVRWEYEPTTFVLSRHPDGLPEKAFSPDFYLPDHDLYLELTTMDQKLIRRKHKKLRQLAAAYPDVQIKLLYQRDYEALARRFGFGDHGASGETG